MGKISYKAEIESPTTVKDFLMKEKGVSRRLLTKLKRVPNGITLNGRHIRSVDEIKNGDIITLTIEDEKFLDPNRGLEVPVSYETENVIVFNKPVNMPVHPSINHRFDTLGNAFAGLYPELTFRPVYRLDRDTSGLCLIAKNQYSAKVLQGNIKKTYYAVVCGEIREAGTIDLPIVREQESVIIRTVREDGKPAITHYRPLQSNGKYTLLEISLETGRTHQIRVHFSYIGYPLAGDFLYNGDCGEIGSQALHCGKIEFNEPVTDEKKTVISEIRDDMKKLLL